MDIHPNDFQKAQNHCRNEDLVMRAFELVQPFMQPHLTFDDLQLQAKAHSIFANPMSCESANAVQ